MDLTELRATLGSLPDWGSPVITLMPGSALPQKSDYLATFEANCMSAPKINLIGPGR